MSVMWNISLIRRLPEVKKSTVRVTALKLSATSREKDMCELVRVRGVHRRMRIASDWESLVLPLSLAPSRKYFFLSPTLLATVSSSQ